MQGDWMWPAKPKVSTCRVALHRKSPLLPALSWQAVVLSKVRGIPVYGCRTASQPASVVDVVFSPQKK